jgi:hypothetical protein
MIESDFAEALACAMAIVPTAYSRNRMFAFFTHPDVKRARARSRAMRSLARELAGHLGRPAGVTLDGNDEQGFVLRFEIPSVRMWRIAELTTVELACVVHLAKAMNVELPFARGNEREILDRALVGLPAGLRPTPGLMA